MFTTTENGSEVKENEQNRLDQHGTSKYDEQKIVKQDRIEKLKRKKKRREDIMIKELMTTLQGVWNRKDQREKAP